MAGRRAPLAILVPLMVLLAGCLVTSTSSSSIGYPSGPSLEQFGLSERCGQGDGTCTDRAMDAIIGALGRRGPEIHNPPVTSAGGAPGADPVPGDRLVIEITVDPMVEWQASSGPAGAGSAFRVDLTDENPYIVVAPRYAFRLSEEDAATIRDALFVSAQEADR